MTVRCNMHCTTRCTSTTSHHSVWFAFTKKNWIADTSIRLPISFEATYYSRTRLETLCFRKFKDVSQSIEYPICFLLSFSPSHENILASMRKIVLLIQVYEHEWLSLARFPERKRNDDICFCSCDAIGGYWITPSTNCTHLKYLIESALFFDDAAILFCC